MPRFRKPFYRKSRDLWYVELDGKQHNLGRDEKEAFRKYHELMNKPEAVASELVVGIIDGFLDWCQKHRKETTFDWYRKHLQSFIRTVPNAKDFAVPDLKPFHVYDWTDAQKDWGDTYRRGAMTALQRAFLWAEKLGHIVKSPIRYLEKPEAKKRDNPLSAEDFQLMLSKIKEGDPFRDLVLFAWYTGARPQEIRHIEPRHVNLNAARIEIPPDEAKGQKRWRKIYLIEPALEIVNKMLARHKDGKLFRNKRGKAWKCFAITCRFITAGGGAVT